MYMWPKYIADHLIWEISKKPTIGFFGACTFITIIKGWRLLFPARSKRNGRI